MPFELEFVNIKEDYKKETIDFVNKYKSEMGTFELSTSGSTGLPKKLIFSKHQLQYSAKATLTKLQLNKDFNALICLNINYIAGKMMLVRCIEANMKALVVSPSSSPFDYIDKNYAIDFAAFVPLQLKQMFERNIEDDIKRLNQIKIILVGGEALDEKLTQKLQTLQSKVYQSFGMTETLSHFALKNISDGDKYYTILEGVAIDIDERNCLKVKSAVTENQWIQTNDIVELIAYESIPTAFTWIGRIDNVINSGGIKVNIELLEALVSNVFIKMKIENKFFIFKLSDAKLTEKVVLFIEGEELKNEIQNRILSEIKSELENPFWVPKNIFFITHFTYTQTGKLDRPNSILDIKK